MDETSEPNHPSSNWLTTLTTGLIYAGVAGGAVVGAVRETGWHDAVSGAMVMALVGGFGGLILAVIIHLLARVLAAVLALIRRKT